MVDAQIIAVQLMIIVGSVSIWRGLWHIMDHYLFPKNKELSAWASLIFGLILVTIMLYFFNISFG
jgi:hypothetical protein